MKSATTAEESLSVDALRVGIFVQLDGGWMSHPFPLSNFRITTRDQIETIRSLGIERVRWSPEQSDPAPGARPGAPSGNDPLPASSPGDDNDDDKVPTTQAAVYSTADDEPTLDVELPPLIEGSDPPGPAGADRFGDFSEAHDARRDHRAQLAAQAAALRLCERQFAEAARDCRLLTDLVLKRPLEARAQAEALTGALATKMLVKEELCIRLLTDAAGDKASVHALNVTIISMLMGRSFGLAEADLLDLGTGALLHDIGKLELPDRVRHPNDQFSNAEIRYYEEHVAHGIGLARRMELSSGATLVIAQHHEQSDGGGFPLRLHSDRMTPSARIVALVDRYDKLCNPFHPGQVLTPHEALSLLFSQSRTMFDTAILGAFIKMMGVYPAGSTVQLSDDRYALVVGVNPNRPLRPRVMVHDARVPVADALILDIGSVPRLGIRRSVRHEHLPAAVRDYLSPRPRVAYFFEPVREASLAT